MLVSQGYKGLNMTQTIHQTLAALKQQIGQLEVADHAARERLESLVTALERRLEDPESEVHHHSLVQETADAITQFEIAHPRITGILNDLMVALGNMGI
jgi:uncharacterized protein YicC (UPF0701 family)